jgi:hypothetical protein
MTERAETQDQRPDPNWSRRIVVALVVAGTLALVWLLGAAFLPRWWAQRIGDQVQGSITAGTLVGLFYGFVFTLLPLVVVWLTVRIFDSWKLRAAGLVVALLFAAPNLLTLGIVLGSGSGAHAGDRILDVEAPAFRGATLTGALIAGACVGVAWYLLASRRRAWRQAGRREAQSDAHAPEGTTPRELP